MMLLKFCRIFRGTALQDEDFNDIDMDDEDIDEEVEVDISSPIMIKAKADGRQQLIPHAYIEKEIV
jgi:hypothetical protein